MKSANAANSHELTWKEIGLLCEGLAFAPRILKVATCSVIKEFSLGPRGAWILILISAGYVYPLDIARFFRVGRSLITSELTRLTEAGLITHQKSQQDRRRFELALTPAGQQAHQRVKDDLLKAIEQRLAGYSRDDILLLTRMLQDVRGTDREAPERRITPSRRTGHGARSRAKTQPAAPKTKARTR